MLLGSKSYIVEGWDYDDSGGGCYKKFELMLTRHVKAYSSSCLQTVSLSLAISSQFILGVCAAAEDHKKNQ